MCSPEEGQVGHKKPNPWCALGPLMVKPLRRGVLPQLVGGLRQAGEVQRSLQLRQLRFAVDVDQVISSLNQLILHGYVLLGGDEGSIARHRTFVAISPEDWGVWRKPLRDSLAFNFTLRR